MRPLVSRPALVLTTALLLAACGSTSSPAASQGQPTLGAGSAAPTALISTGVPTGAPPSAGGSSPGSSGASSGPGAGATGQTLPTGLAGANLCTLLKAFDFNTTLGVTINKSVWDGHECVWYNTSVPGGATVGWQPESQVAKSFTSAALAIPGTVSPPGLGLRAVGHARTGLPAPLAPTDALLLVDFGTIGLSIHVSGPAVTLNETIQIEQAVLAAG